MLTSSRRSAKWHHKAIALHNVKWTEIKVPSDSDKMVHASGENIKVTSNKIRVSSENVKVPSDRFQIPSDIIKTSKERNIKMMSKCHVKHQNTEWHHQNVKMEKLQKYAQVPSEVSKYQWHHQSVSIVAHQSDLIRISNINVEVPSGTIKWWHVIM